MNPKKTTNSPRWHFNKRRPCDRLRDPENDAFFTSDGVKNLSDAVIREAIQNSLDAAQRDAGPRHVRVRVTLYENGTEAMRRFLKCHFIPAREHFESGLEESRLCDVLEKAGVLVIEDFGTTGLGGDVEEYREKAATSNAFFSFFRAEGISPKAGQTLGRWGIGKQVFLLASRLHAMFGLSVREDEPSKVLMGSAVLRHHTVGGEEYQPDAWFGIRDRDDELVLPVTDSAFLESFERCFDLTRRNETGLSVVVPCPDDRLNHDDLVRAVLRNFFWPILRDELTVHLKSAEKEHKINRTNILDHATAVFCGDPDMHAVMQLASWASSLSPGDCVELHGPAATKPAWNEIGDTLLPSDVLNRIRGELKNNGRVAIRVPVPVCAQKPPREQSSFFTVYLQSCSDGNHQPLFLREGILISDVRPRGIAGIRSLVVVEDGPLAALLGDAEGVNHTQWQKDSPKFHNKYRYGPQTIDFVKFSVRELCKRLDNSDSGGDPDLLLDFFYLPADNQPQRHSLELREGPPERSAPPGELNVHHTPQKFDVQKVPSGFQIVPADIPSPFQPFKLRVEVAYAVRRGDPLKRWSPYDFKLIKPPLSVQKHSQVRILREQDNLLEIEVLARDFSFAITGFDPNRNLQVRVIELQESAQE